MATTNLLVCNLWLLTMQESKGHYAFRAGQNPTPSHTLDDCSVGSHAFGESFSTEVQVYLDAWNTEESQVL